MRSPSSLFYIVFPYANRSSSSNRLKFWAIRRYFDKKGILILSAKFLIEQFPNEFSNISNAKNFLKRTLKVMFNPYETDKYIIKTNVETYDGKIPADYLHALSLAKNPDVLNFYTIYFEKQQGWGATVISIYGEESTKKIIESISKRSLGSIFPSFKEEINSFYKQKTFSFYKQEEIESKKSFEEPTKLEKEKQEKYEQWEKEYEQRKKELVEEWERKHLEKCRRIDEGTYEWYDEDEFIY